MTTIPISASSLFQGGRINSYDPAVAESFLKYSQVLTTDTLEFNFPNAQATGNIFGQVRAVFINNTDNDFDLEVLVSGTGHRFPVYANTTGYYALDTQEGSTVSITSAGISTDTVEIIFYNAPKYPVVWYEASIVTGSVTVTGNVATTVADGANVALGNTGDAAVTNPALAATVISLLKGLVTLWNTFLGYFAPASITEAATLTITAGGVAQQVFNDNANRKTLFFQNTSSNNMLLRFGANPSATLGILVPPGGSLFLQGPSCVTDDLNVYGVSTGDTFYAWQS